MRFRFLLLVSLLSTLCTAEVILTEERLILPTYETKDPDKVPLFFRSEEVQLAERHIYPYPFYDVQSTEKIDKSYQALILENEYIRLCVTPELGGRLYYCQDKTNEYELVYYNHVVKPALIGTLGAWISGGVEWNTPHHHRATSMIPVDYALQNHKDGSKTIWVGEYEKRSQTRWMTGVTLAPDSACVKLSFKSMNVTPFQYPALYFANVAVHVNDSYQIIFPPDVEMMNFHYVTEFTRWPVLNQVYQSVDYTKGEDLSWWKETKQPVSFFVTKTDQDFMGGIDHDKDAGIALVGDRHIFKGKKLWNWGKNEVQEVWDQKLTDDDGPYAELMMGFYSDNQPDYNFVAPFETKYGDMYLYGIKGLKDIKEANQDCALNLEIHENTALIQINTTSPQPKTVITLRREDNVIWEKTVTITPESPWQETVPIPQGSTLENLEIMVHSHQGRQLARWQKQPLLNEEFPDIYHDPLDPGEYTTSQELYQAGLKLEQYGNTTFDYMKYYERALQLDPDHVATNTRLGQLYLKRGEYEKAQSYLKRAADIVTANHTKAEDADSLYYLALTYLQQDKIEEALHYLYRATWAYEWTSAGYTAAARLEGRQGRWEKALDAAERAYAANQYNGEAATTQSIVLRKLGRYEEAQKLIQHVCDEDPLNFLALYEQIRLDQAENKEPNADKLTDLKKILRNEPYNYIETANRYADFGLYEEAAAVMQYAATSDLPELNADPMVYYHLALYEEKQGHRDKAKAARKTAASLPVDLCFPYGEASIKALRHALEQEQDDAIAWQLLGNALADHQHEAAVSCWEKAARYAPDTAMLYRNMAYIQANHFHKMPDAMDNIMKAISLDPTEPRFFSEAQLYMSYASLTAAELSEFLSHNGSFGKDVVEIQLMQIKLNLYEGKYDDAIVLLENLEYHSKEGASFNPHTYWVDAHLQRGIHETREGLFDAAEKSLLRTMEFPPNLEAERDNKIAIAYYYLGLNRKAAGDLEKAKEYFQQMVSYTPARGWGAGDFPELTYFKAMAQRELGDDPRESEEQFRELIRVGEKRLDTEKDGRHITVFLDESHTARKFLLEQELDRKERRVSSYYLQALGFLGLGDTEQAHGFFAKALEVDPLSVDPKFMLDQLTQKNE